MKNLAAVLISFLLMTMTAVQVSQIDAQTVPDWVKRNAGWWANGQITESDFLTGIQFLLEEKVITIQKTTRDDVRQISDFIPDWVKRNAGWWANGQITESDFLRSLEYLINVGIITINTNQEKTEQKMTDSELSELQKELEQCLTIKKAYERLSCEKAVKKQIVLHEYKMNSQPYEVGPINYYWKGIGSEGNSFEISASGQALLSIRMLAENARESENVVLYCTGPAICNYDVWNGQKAFKYAGTDFTNGQIVLKPGEAREFNILFGPNIGYGGSTFEYDPSREYYFRINEPFGNEQILLELD